MRLAAAGHTGTTSARCLNGYRSTGSTESIDRCRLTMCTPLICRSHAPHLCTKCHGVITYRCMQSVLLCRDVYAGESVSKPSTSSPFGSSWWHSCARRNTKMLGRRTRYEAILWNGLPTSIGNTKLSLNSFHWLPTVRRELKIFYFQGASPPGECF